MIDASNYEVISRENRGAHPNKIWLLTPEVMYGKNRIALFKPTESKMDGTKKLTHFAEMIYSDISNELLGFPCAKIQKVMYNGNIGVLSYNVLDELPDNNEDNTRYILQDMATIINTVEDNFDVENLRIRDKQEYFSVEMILKAIKNATTSEEEYKALEEFIINLCLVDSLTNYRDRHSLNLSAGYDNTTGNLFPVAIYDNGESFGIDTSEETLKKSIELGVDAEKMRAATSSKIGILSRTPISFDLLETLIFNHFYIVAKPMVEKMANVLLPESLDEIFSREEYSDMPEIYKTFIKDQVEYNREEMIKRMVKSRSRNEIERYIDEPQYLDSYIEDLERINGRKFSNRAEALNHVLTKVFTSDAVQFEQPILTMEDYRILEEIENSPETFCDGSVICLEHDKNIAKWSVIYNKLLNAMDKNIPEKEKREQLDGLFINKMNFYPLDILEINLITNVYNIEPGKQDPLSVRALVQGTSDRRGIGDERVDSYLILQHAKAIVNGTGMEAVEEFEKSYIDVVEKQRIIEDSTKKDDKGITFIKNAGIKDDEEAYKLIYFALDKIKEKNKHFTSQEDFEKFVIEQAKYFEKGKYDVIAGSIITKANLQLIKNNTYTLPNGEKAAIVTESIQGFSNITMGLGIDHAIQIQIVDENGNYGIVCTRSKDVEFPESLQVAMNQTEAKLKKSLKPMEAKRVLRRIKKNDDSSKVGEIIYYRGNLSKTTEEENILLCFDKDVGLNAGETIDAKRKLDLTIQLKNYLLTLYGRPDKVIEINGEQK